jgi:hypothetical protein
MNRAHFIAAGAGLALWTGAGTTGASATSQKRSLWVWQTPLDQASEVAAFASRNDFALVFLSVVATERSALEAGAAKSLDALRALKSLNLTLYGVAGDPSWVKHKRSGPPQSVVKLLAAHRSYGIFDGIALDLEPHTLPEWKDDSEKAGLAENYLDVLRLVRSAAAREDLPLLATVHPTYAKYSPPSSKGETLLQSAARAVDATDLMAYRNAENTLESFGGLAMEQLAGVARSWWLGVSTHVKSPPGTSYATVPAARFFPDIDATAAALEKRYGRSFAGISVEDYRNSVALLGKNSG